MIEIQWSKLIFAALVGIIVTVGFDAILHGLSHSGHGILNFLWSNEKFQRNSQTSIFSSILWHINADILIGVLLSILIALIQKPGVLSAVTLGLIVGLLLAAQWIHVYAAFETSKKVILGLGALTILQVILASIAISLTYWRT